MQTALQYDMQVMPAVVARILRGSDSPIYLKDSSVGRYDWVNDPAAATPFQSMREATRRAACLPPNLRAFGIVRQRTA